MLDQADQRDEEFQSTLSVRRATRPPCSASPDRSISIHALREESDHAEYYAKTVVKYFNPRSP